MHIVIFGGLGMIGQGVLREALLDRRVTRVTAVVRSRIDQDHPKLAQVVRSDMTQLDDLRLACDACCFAIGVTSAGMAEAAYTRLTYDTAIAAAKAVLSPSTTFMFVSGAGAEGNSMWARVKRRAETDLQAMPFRAVYVFRPAFVRPMNGIRSRTRMYNILYKLLWPLQYVIPARFRTTTERIGHAMMNLAQDGFEQRILETPEINRAAAGVRAGAAP
ncbi:MAG: epimerase [Gammaproteobacteria bacterium]|nr:epimerase [Gammaproteobacteria bacterium]